MTGRSEEQKTLATMIGIFCRGKHGTGEGLCDACGELLAYVETRLEKCPHGEQKPKCSHCPIHCHKPAMRDRIREVMRYAGPRMALRHPVMAIKHMLQPTKPPATSGRAKRDLTGDELLVALQRGVPLVARPFAELGKELGLAEAEVLKAAAGLFERGVARRFGAVFDSRRLGYGSTLCAVDVAADEIERVAALFDEHPGVTHCYEREGHPNLWFTLTAPADCLESELAVFAEQLKPRTLLNLPAMRRFKVQVVLNSASGDAGAPASVESDREDSAAALTEREKAVVRAMQGNVKLTSAPFAAVADELGWDETELLALLAGWKRRGVLRRVAVILRHRRAGFLANGMCVWEVPSDRVEAAGRQLAGAPEVTHCYERPPPGGFPYNLFAMVHAREREEARAVFERLSRQAGLTHGKMLISVREFKKTSPVFFQLSD